ncbi:MAG: hypothetical protein PWQ79_460 [Thermococcaceae archaeon]|nr:hypothetical protein [Thermococcaceae archaeon]MDK2913545.1 hypothetical protein [Thermococcaceae archaeon]
MSVSVAYVWLLAREREAMEELRERRKKPSVREDY